MKSYKKCCQRGSNFENIENGTTEFQNKSLTLNKISVNKNAKQKYSENKFVKQSKSNNVPKLVNRM